MSNLDRLTREKGRRLDLPPFVDGKRNLARLEPDILEKARVRYAEQSGRKDASHFWLKDGDPACWTWYLGIMGERGVADLMGFRDEIGVNYPGGDPGYDFRKILRIDDATHLWWIDCKTFDNASKWRAKTVLLNAKQAARMHKRALYVWCCYFDRFDMAWPIGWELGAKLKLEERIPNGDFLIDRFSLRPMSELARASWVTLAA